MPRRCRVSLPGGGEVYLTATDRADAIAQFNVLCGVTSTVHQYDVEWLEPEAPPELPAIESVEPEAFDAGDMFAGTIAEEVLDSMTLPNGLTELPDGNGPGEPADTQEPDHHQDDGADLEPESGPFAGGPIGEPGDVPGATEPAAGPGEQADSDSGRAGGE